MAKKKVKRAPAIARAEVLLKGMEQPVLVQESYATVKKRLLDMQPFVEVTDLKRIKVIFAKDVIASVLPRV